MLRLSSRSLRRALVQSRRRTPGRTCVPDHGRRISTRNTFDDSPPGIRSRSFKIGSRRSIGAPSRWANVGNQPFRPVFDNPKRAARRRRCESPKPGQNKRSVPSSSILPLRTCKVNTSQKFSGSNGNECVKCYLKIDCEWRPPVLLVRRPIEPSDFFVGAQVLFCSAHRLSGDRLLKNLAS